MTNQEVIQARATEVQEFLKHFAYKVTWSWVRDYILSQYTVGVLKIVVERETGEKAQSTRFLVERQIYDIWKSY